MLSAALPSWLPSWIELALLLLAALVGFVLLLMPFAVFGLKGRLQVIEARVEDLGADIRMLSGRISESRRILSPLPPLLPEDDAMPATTPTLREVRRRAPAPLPPRPVEPGFDRPALDRQDGCEPPPRDRDRWFDPDEEHLPPRPPRVPTAELPANERPAPERPAAERSPLDRDPDRLRYSGRSRTGTGDRDRDRGGEREEPSLRWPPR